MSLGMYTAGEPSSIVTGGTPAATFDILDFGGEGTAEIDKAHVSDLPFGLDGGILKQDRSYRVRARDGKASGDAAGTHALKAMANTGTVVSTFVAVQPGKGASGAQTLTTTIASARIESISKSNANRRGEVECRLWPISSDGSTDPVVEAWS